MKYIKNFNEVSDISLTNSQRENIDRINKANNGLPMKSNEFLFDGISGSIEDVLPMLKLYSSLYSMLDDSDLRLYGGYNVFEIIKLSLDNIRAISGIAKLLSIEMCSDWDYGITSIKDFIKKPGYPELIFSDIKKIYSEVLKFCDDWNKLPLDHYKKVGYPPIFNSHIDRFKLFLMDIIKGYSIIKDIKPFKFSSLDIEERLLDFIDSGKIYYGGVPGVDISTFYDFEECRGGFSFRHYGTWNKLLEIKKSPVGYYIVAFSPISEEIYSDIMNRLKFNFKIIHTSKNFFEVQILMIDK